MSTAQDHARNRGLRLLSFDDGGIHILAALIKLNEVLQRLNHEDGLEGVPRPCDVFDLAGGTGTGGIIATMLYWLQMSVDDAIKSYIQLAQKASLLEDVIAEIIQTELKVTREHAMNVVLLDETEAASRWLSERQLSSLLFQGGRIWTALIYGGLRSRNPVKYVVEEARILFPNRPISYVLSLGTGSSRVIGLDRPDAFQKILPTKLITVLKGIDCESQSEEMAREMSREGIMYCRLNVDKGLEEVSLAE